jgi:PAS domain S-box-containing protein
MKIFPLGIASQGPFKRQIILTFAGGFFLLMTAFAVYQVRVETANLYRDSTSKTTALATSLAISSRSWILANDVAGLQEVVHAFQGHQELRYAMIIAPSGRILAHTDATRVGQFLSDAPSLALIQASPQTRVMIDNPSAIDVAVPIMIETRHIGWARIGFGREDIAKNLREMILNNAVFLLTALVLSLIPAVLVANRLGKRIGSLMQVAKEVQAGNFDMRASVSGREDEITSLADSLNQMLDTLAQNEKELRTASLYTRSLIEASLDPLVTINPDGKITDVNKATEKVTGRNRNELIGTDFSDYFTDPDKARKGYQQGFIEGSVTDYALAIRHRDGHIIEVLYNASVYRDETGEVLGVFAAARDVTEHKIAEATRTQLAAIVEFSNDAIIGKTPDGTITTWNKSAEKIYGYSA